MIRPAPALNVLMVASLIRLRVKIYLVNATPAIVEPATVAVVVICAQPPALGHVISAMLLVAL
jgi:hypothetical protein